MSFHQSLEGIRVRDDPIRGGGISPEVCLHSTAVFFVCIVPALSEVGDVGEIGTGPPPFVEDILLDSDTPFQMNDKAF